MRGRASLNRQEEKAYGLVQKSVVLVAMHNPEPAVLVLQEAQHLADSLPMTITGRRQGEFELDAAWAQYYESIHDYQRAEKYWQRALQEATAAKLTVLKWRYMRRLFDFYGKRRQDAVAQQYARDYLILSDTLNAARGSYNVAQYDGERIEKAQNAQIANLRQERAVQAVRLQQRNILLAVSLIALVVVGSLGGFIYWQLRIHKQTLQQLRKTQNQLVQSEKWAFVGEVSAGIAHELQNPLNFMKKFAEVSTSMVDDINHRDAGKNAGLEQEILSGLRQNLQEISQHGMRASSIIKDMLEHSRAGTGQREPTNLNALISEYLQLARQSHVPAEEVDSIVFDMQLTSNLPLVPVVPADMGRVLLNLCTNALYAVCQHQLAGDSTYQPTISLSTHAEPGWVEVRVRDNGPGIASEVQAKVFQPFFTTKPIGEGTGLGLSISHDIVKAHGGTFSVASREGEYTEFVVRLPA
ncbi:sensor histidine kinase [Hymenobacter sp. AT01-02]|uniref:sensor histidine kinase n=1 Tax=Hymenobacter sp. AT01-02 TaxID=1571877 RepID=UPI000AA33337|nr:ATP-binding protein [Hymenobacter sp. AT01-02]